MPPRFQAALIAVASDEASLPRYFVNNDFSGVTRSASCLKITFQQILGQNMAGRHLVINSGLGKRSPDCEARRALRRCRAARCRSTHKEICDNKSDNIRRHPEQSTSFRSLASPL